MLHLITDRVETAKVSLTPRAAETRQRAASTPRRPALVAATGLLAAGLVAAAAVFPGAGIAQAAPAHSAHSTFTATLVATGRTDRAKAGALAGRTLSAPTVVYLRSSGARVREVDFRVDKGGWHRDSHAPFDLVGGTSHKATSWNPAKIAAGSHTLTARVVTSDGKTHTVTARFHVAHAAPRAIAVANAMVGMPDASNTGPVGPLTPSGSLTITSPGIYSGLDVHGHIDVESPGVTLTNVRVDASDADYAIRNESGSHLTITNCDLGPTGTPTHQTEAAVIYANYTLERCNVHGTGDGLKAHGDSVIEDNYIHDMFESDGNHSDGIQISSGSNVVISHNTIVSAPVDSSGAVHQGVSCVMVKSDQGPISNVQIEGNSLSGDPGFLLYDRAGAANPTPSDVVIEANSFGPKQSAPTASDGYYYGVLSADAPQPTVADNTTS